jgi:hypothetical protein
MIAKFFLNEASEEASWPIIIITIIIKLSTVEYQKSSNEVSWKQ